MSRIFMPRPTYVNGQLLCLCGCNRPTQPPYRRFHDGQCYERFRIRNETRFARQKVQERDHGVCARCGVDTYQQLKQLRKLPYGARHAALQELRITQRRYRMGSLWDAHHVRAVKDGGGGCDLDNLITLCLKCHKQETQKLLAKPKPQPLSALQIAKHHAESVNFD